ncbi:hypothetical protein M501DRAFT_996367 [Patellaria atrata CBS 101060]|uniref:Inactive metallocarboxypeptidase ECM14 n=1 Tax=Patellaria atrata CBS 101060 TaxID=1346257 RepID=A0A9P4VNX6_9PEZI|nr:hypothetical protein M501DRAFT_996367 [Patellaria atrata CBS 101060]
MRADILTLATLISLTTALVADIPSSSRPENNLRPWRRISDQIIRKIWRIPEKQNVFTAPKVDSSLANHGLPLGKLQARYGEDMVLRFNISTPKEASALAEASSILFLDVWEFTEDWVDIRMAKDVVPSLLGLLPDSLKHSHRPLMRDFSLAETIFDTQPSSGSDPSAPSNGLKTFTLGPSSSSKVHENNIFFSDYQPLSVITHWMQLLRSLFPTHVRLANIGISYEGRDIPAMRVGVHPKNNDKPSGPRKTIIISGGSHAREWISVSTVNYVAWSLITSFGKSRSVTELLEAFDWIFIPTLNPDGYVYSWETDRLWRKNRQPTSLRFCNGVDLDRSFNFKWDGESSRGNPCSESYAGEAPFEGVEAKRFADWAKNETENHNVEFVGFLDLHSYSQQVLYPYSFSCTESPPTLENLEELALGLAKAIRVSHGGYKYKATSACQGNVAMTGVKKIFPRMESGGGSALDWFYHELRVNYAYQIKLRDTGSYGFLLPKDNIIPTGKEMLHAVKYFGKYLAGEIGLADTASSEEPQLKDPEPEPEIEDVEDVASELRRRRRR